MNETDITTVPSRDLQRRTREVLNAVMTGRHVFVSRWDKPEAVVVSADWYDRAVTALFNAEVNSADDE
jgi:prevent-host-death family protein